MKGKRLGREVEAMRASPEVRVSMRMELAEVVEEGLVILLEVILKAMEVPAV